MSYFVVAKVKGRKPSVSCIAMPMQWVPNLGYPSLSEKKHEASSKSSVGNADSKNIRPASASPTPKMATAAQYASMGARLSVKPTPLRAPKSMNERRKCFAVQPPTRAVEYPRGLFGSPLRKKTPERPMSATSLREYAWEGDRGRAFAESRPQSAQGREGRRSTPHKGTWESMNDVSLAGIFAQGIFPADEMADKRTRPLSGFSLSGSSRPSKYTTLKFSGPGHQRPVSAHPVLQHGEFLQVEALRPLGARNHSADPALDAHDHSRAFLGPW